MAAVFRLANVDQTTTVDLLNGALKLRYNSFAPRTPAFQNQYTHVRFGAQQHFQYYGVQVETFDVFAQDTLANVIAAIYAIEQMLEKVRLWHEDPLRYESVWLEWNSNGESPKRSLIFEGSIQYPADVVGANAFNDHGLMARLSLSRHPLWEDTAYTNVTASVSAFGGKWVPTVVAGTAPARVRQFLANTLMGGPPYNIWVGMRETLSGTGSFNPVWELENGTAGTDTTSAAVAGASGGNAMHTVMSTFSLVKRCSITLAQGSGLAYPYTNQWIGRYLVLMRCKGPASTTFGIRLDSGYSGSAKLAPNSEVYFSDSDENWRLINLGEIQIPPIGHRTALAYLKTDKFQIQIFAERISGAGTTLDMDALILIPSTHFFAIEGAGTENLFATDEDDRVSAVGLTSSVPDNSIAVVSRDFYVPVEGCVIVVAAERQTQHVLTDTLSVGALYYPRWLSFRNT